MSTKNFYLAGLLSFLFCAGSVEASKYSSPHVVKQSVDDALKKDKADFINQMKNSRYYDLGKSLEDASDDYLYLANLLSQWGMEESRTKKEGIYTVRLLMWHWWHKLKNQKTNPQKPWEKLLLDIANRYIEKNTQNATQQDRENEDEAVFNHSILDSIIANYNLMSFTDVETIKQKGQDGDGKYSLLNDWAILFFHCNEAAIHYGKIEDTDTQTDTKREREIRQSYDWMEGTHTYVQLWYPIFSISTARPKAPRMSPVLFCQIKRCQDLCFIYIKSIRELFERTLNFMGLKYDFKYDFNDQKIERTNNKIQHISWIRKPHNFERITRYLQALSMVGMGKTRDDLLEYLKSGVDNWEKFCDNDSKAISKKGDYDRSIGFWFNAKEDSRKFEGQINYSQINNIIRENEGSGLSSQGRYDGSSYSKGPEVYEDKRYKEERERGSATQASVTARGPTSHSSNGAASTLIYQSSAKPSANTQLTNARGPTSQPISSGNNLQESILNKDASSQSVQLNVNQPISNTQPAAGVGSPAPQSISSGNSAAPQQKIRKNKAQGKRQRRRGKKTYRKSNRKSRKTRKTRKKR